MALSAPGGGVINPEEADNFEEIEKQFAVKVVEHMSTYWAILEKMPGSKLRLTKMDDDILQHFNRHFPDFDLKATINEDDMKSKEGKEQWRTFVNEYEGKVEDYNFGAMLRANSTWEYGEKETIFAVRMQFYAVEIARNRAGLNDWIYEKAQQDKASASLVYSLANYPVHPQVTKPNGILKFSGQMPPNRRSDTTQNQPSIRAKDDSPQDTEKKLPTPWKALFFFTTRAQLPLLVAGAISSLLAGATSPFTSYVTGKLFQGFTDYAAGKYTGEALLQEQRMYVLYLVAIGAGSWIFHSLDFVFWLAFGELQAKSARDRLFYGLLEKDIEWYDRRKNGIGALLPRLQAQIRDLQLATSQPLGILFSALAQCILSLTEAFYYQWKVAAMTLVLAPVLMTLFAVVAGTMQKHIQVQQDKLGEAQKFAISAFGSIETVKCFNGQEAERDKYMLRVNSAAASYSRIAFAAGLQQGAAAFFGSAMFVLAFYYGGVVIRNGEATVADVMTSFFAAVGGFQALQSILPQMVNLEKGRTAGSSLRAVMAEVQRGGVVQSNQGWLTPRTCKGDIDVKNVTFAYPSRPDQLALDDVTMFIAGSEMTFLIGRSGSGKSTISQLLMGFYRVAKGQIMIDEVSLDTLDVGWLRSKVTLVEQTSLLFNATVFDNIAFGGPDHENVTRAEVMQAVEFALLQLMISDMPNGLETVVGYKGGTMSGGQRQRIALARARLRDTPILILDESTSALDHISRALMMDAIRLWRKGKTTIIITHDISQILADDYVLLLEHGKLVQQGYRRHLEKMKDTPFQSFLPIEQRATLSPYDARKATMSIFESIRTRGSSIDTLGHDFDEGYVTHDLLEARMDAYENKRITFLPAVFETSHTNPVMGPLGRVVPGALGGWMPGSNLSPTSPRSSMRFSQLLDGENALTNPESNGSNSRWSGMLQTLIDRTGRQAADARTAGQRKAFDVKMLSLALAEDHDLLLARKSKKRSAEQVSSHRKWTLAEVMLTIWPNATLPSRIMLVLGVYSCTVHAISVPLFAYILSQLLSTYAQPVGSAHKQLIYALSILGIAVADGLHTWMQRYNLGRAGQSWVDSFRDRAITRILDQPKVFFDAPENSVSHLVDSLDRNAEAMRELLSTFTSLGYVALMMCVVSLLWALAAQWKMTLIALSVGPYILAVSRVYASISGKWETASADAAETASAIFTETFTNIKTVRALTLEEHFRQKYVTATNKGLTIGLQRSFHTGFFFGLSDSATSFATAMIFYIGTVLIKNGAPVMKCIQVFVMLIFALTNIGVILSCIPEVGSNLDAASRLMRLAYLPKDSHEHLGDTNLVRADEIVFTNLRFAYPSRPEQAILNNINIHFPPGTSTALVGGSGSGKSTIANLLLDLWSVAQCSSSSGDIQINTREIRTLSTPSIRAQIVPVLQTPTLFAATVAENITYGLSPLSPYNNLRSVTEAAKAAGIHDFIVSLPLAYDTLIGEGGVGLSGGQAQRVNIARALVRRPGVLILDEATSALDVESAELIRQTLVKLVNDKRRAMTVIIITHSRDMMEMAERIVVLDRGSIVEEGGFEELMGKSGGALVNLLNGGEWTGAEGSSRAAGKRTEGVPKLKAVDWQKKQCPGKRRGTAIR
ncbi:ATP-dependent permease [Recurvomyces mirabilis]|uniref:Protein PBDC1 homolog n=2 Tax=Recurvomyces mirabilis TaxID=574656 RepID=A0AAE0WNG8_9PEZI|nr:ATP-dependent permease [Recurvomyces mirabilis]